MGQALELAGSGGVVGGHRGQGCDSDPTHQTIESLVPMGGQAYKGDFSVVEFGQVRFAIHIQRWHLHRDRPAVRGMLQRYHMFRDLKACLACSLRVA